MRCIIIFTALNHTTMLKCVRNDNDMQETDLTIWYKFFLEKYY